MSAHRGITPAHAATDYHFPSVLRHTALFLHRDTTTLEQSLAMLKGLSYLRFECRSVRALDFGPDLTGGSARRRELKPWQRTPVWRAQREGPASPHDVALHLDFDDDAGFDAYNEDPAHAEVGAYNASINQGELTARINYWYEGPPAIAPGLVRHTALFLWKPGAGDAEKAAASDAAAALADAPGVERVTIGHNQPLLATDYDWIMDLQVTDAEGLRGLLGGDRYAAATAAVIPATQYEWTATVSHLMRGF